ncbi:MAG: hypothetical protein ACI4XA_10450 [Oscillospiraceae bacterium]
MTIIKPFKAGKGLAPTVRNISTLGNDIPDNAAMFRDEELTYKQDNAMTGEILLTLLEALRQFRVQSGGNISVSNNTTVIRNNICSIVNNYRAAGGSGSVSLNLLLQSISDAFSAEAPSQQSTELLINRLSEQLSSLGITPTKRSASVSEIRNGNAYNAGMGRTAELILKKNADLSGNTAFFGDIIGEILPHTANEPTAANEVSPAPNGSRGAAESLPLRERNEKRAPEPKEPFSFNAPNAPKAPENRLSDIFPLIPVFFKDKSRYETHSSHTAHTTHSIHTTHSAQNNTEFRDNSRIIDRSGAYNGSADSADSAVGSERGVSGAIAPEDMPAVPAYSDNSPYPPAPAVGGYTINAANFLSSNFYSDIADTLVGAAAHIGGQTINAPAKSVFAEYNSAQSVTGAAFFGDFVSNRAFYSRAADRAAFVGGERAASELILLNSYNTEYERFLRGDNISREEAVYHIFHHSPADAGKTGEKPAARRSPETESEPAAKIPPEAAAKSYGSDVISKLPEGSAEVGAGFVGGNILPHTEELFYLGDGAFSGGISPSDSSANPQITHGAAENNAPQFPEKTHGAAGNNAPQYPEKTHGAAGNNAPQYPEKTHGAAGNNAPHYPEKTHSAPAEERRIIPKFFGTDISDNTAPPAAASRLRHSEFMNVMTSVFGDIFRTVQNSAVNNDINAELSPRNYSVGNTVNRYSDKFTELNYYGGDRLVFGGDNAANGQNLQNRSTPAPQKPKTDIFVGTELSEFSELAYSRAETIYSSLNAAFGNNIERPEESAPSRFTELFRATNSYVSEASSLAPANAQSGAAVGANPVSGETVKLATANYTDYSKVMTSVFGDIFRTVQNSAVNNDINAELSPRNYSVGNTVNRYSDKFTELNYYGGDRLVFGGDNAANGRYTQIPPNTAAQKLPPDISAGTKPAPARAETLYNGFFAAGNASEKTYEKLFEALIYSGNFPLPEYRASGAHSNGDIAARHSGARHAEPLVGARAAEKTSPAAAELSQAGAANAASAAIYNIGIFNRAQEFVENVLGRAGVFGAETAAALIRSDNFTEIYRKEHSKTLERLIHHISPNTAEVWRAPNESAPEADPTGNRSRENERGYSPTEQLIHAESPRYGGTAALPQMSRAAVSSRNGLTRELLHSAAAVLQYSQTIQKTAGAPPLRALMRRSSTRDGNGSSGSTSSPLIFGDNIRQTLQSYITHGGFSFSSAPSEYYRAIFPKSSAGALPNEPNEPNVPNKPNERSAREIEHYIGGNITLPPTEPPAQYKATPAAAQRGSIHGMGALVSGDAPQPEGTLPQPRNAALGDRLVFKENITELLSGGKFFSEKNTAARYPEPNANAEPLTLALNETADSAEAAREHPSPQGETGAEQPEAALPTAEEIYSQLNIDSDITRLLSSEEALSSYVRNQINSYFSEQNSNRADNMILNSYRSVEIICERVLSRLESRLKTERRLSGR